MHWARRRPTGYISPYLLRGIVRALLQERRNGYRHDPVLLLIRGRWRRVL